MIFNIVPFRNEYHALFGCTAFAHFNIVPHYAYMDLKMPGPKGIIIVNSNTKKPIRTEEHMAALAAECQHDSETSSHRSAIKARKEGVTPSI